MKPKHWLLLGGMLGGVLSCSIVLGAFMVAYPPYTTQTIYRDEIDLIQVWRVNNWTGSRELLIESFYYDSDQESSRPTVK